jgi:phosphoribosylamine--glycine ligase
LLETDLLEIAEACVNGNFNEVDLHWKEGAAVCLVLASKGYPEKVESGKLVNFETLPANTICFHAGTKMDENQNIVTAGGRVFGMTTWADKLEIAITDVYANIGKVWFEGVQYRKDIGKRTLLNGLHNGFTDKTDVG